MSDLNCSVCGKLLDFYIDMPIYHDTCDHYACAHTCSDGSSELCQKCENKSTVAVNNDIIDEVSVAIPVKTYDPRPIQPRDAKWADGFFSWANNISSGLRNRNETVNTSNDPYWLIKQHVPVEVLLEKDLHINELISQGVTLEHFLSGGYNIKELAQFPEVLPTIGKTDIFPKGVLVLFALKTRMHQLRDHKDQMPIAEVCKYTGLNKKYMAENMRLEFHPTIGITSEGNKGKWTLQDLKYFGFDSMKSFISDLGLRKAEHWFAFNPTPFDVETFKVTQQQMWGLNGKAKGKTYIPSSYYNDNIENNQRVKICQAPIQKQQERAPRKKIELKSKKQYNILGNSQPPSTNRRRILYK